MHEESGTLMAEAIATTASSYLGGAETFISLTAQVYPVELRAVVWVLLRNPSVDAQLDAISSFSSVRECYADEYQVDLRFGEPDVGSNVRADAAKSVVHATH